MRSLKYVLAALVLLCITPALSFAQTATPTATPSPVAIPSPVPFLSRITHFGFLAADAANGGLLGGYVVHLTATAALTVGQVVCPDSSNNNSVVVCAGGATNPIGVVIGAGTMGAAGQRAGLGVNPGAAQIAIVQVNGVVQAICDGTIARGTKMMVSSAIVGGITTYSAGTVDEQIGVLLSSCTNANPGNLLLYK